MSLRRVEPSRALIGVIKVPGDKSISHRALLINLLGEGQARITGLLCSEDVMATLEAVRALGARVVEDGDDYVIYGAGTLKSPLETLDCGNSGTTMRLLCGVLAGAGVTAVLDGDDSLRRRPMDRVIVPLKRLGADICSKSDNGLAPVMIRPGQLAGGSADLKIASAQVKSCLLLAGLQSGVRVREPAQSRNHTELMLQAMGAPLTRDKDGWWCLEPSGSLQCVDVVVPGDISSAAFWMVAASIVKGSEVRIRCVGLNPTRSGVFDALIQMGADIECEAIDSGSAEAVCDLVVRYRGLKGVDIEGDLALRCIDELPVLAVAGAFASGVTRIKDAAELRVKESDRIAMTAGGLRQLGFTVSEFDDGLQVVGGDTTSAATIDADGDHRIAMSFAVAGLAGRHSVTLRGAESVLTSYPNFFHHLEELSHVRAD